MTRTAALFSPPRRTAGPYERALAETLRTWRTRNHLVGPEHAAHRAILRGLARLADAATARTEAGDLSEYATATVVDRYRQAFDAYAAPPADSADTAGDRLASAALAIIGDLA